MLCIDIFSYYKEYSVKKVGYVNTGNFQHNTTPIFIFTHGPDLYTRADFYIADAPIFPIFSPCGSSLCKLCCVTPTGGFLKHKKISNKKRSCKLVGLACMLQRRFLPSTCIRAPIFTDILQHCADFHTKIYRFSKNSALLLRESSI